MFSEPNSRLSVRAMSRSSGSRGVTGERSRSENNQLQINPEFTRTLTKSSPRFDTLNQHSFFSRHNPHPHRVKHIQGLNGRPVCMVRDDWFVTSSLFPHPLLKSHVFRKATNSLFAFPNLNLSGLSPNKDKSAQFSEAWKDELKDLAAKVSLSSQTQNQKKEVHPGEEFVRRKTQYSAETGRILPPSTSSYQRRPRSQCPVPLQHFHDQEFMVFEILCQILQTDSLSTVQQWLLLAGQREKELVMGMIKQALDGVDLSTQHQHNFQQLETFHPACGTRRKPQRMSSCNDNRAVCAEKPERIGDAEVLEVHTGTNHQVRPLQTA